MTTHEIRLQHFLELVAEKVAVVPLYLKDPKLKFLIKGSYCTMWIIIIVIMWNCKTTIVSRR